MLHLTHREGRGSVKTLRSPFPAEFKRHCVLSGRNQRHVLPQHQSEENGNMKYIISWGENRIHNLSRRALWPCVTTSLNFNTT